MSWVVAQKSVARTGQDEIMAQSSLAPKMFFPTPSRARLGQDAVSHLLDFVKERTPVLPNG